MVYFTILYHRQTVDTLSSMSIKFLTAGSNLAYVVNPPPSAFVFDVYTLPPPPTKHGDFGVGRTYHRNYDFDRRFVLSATSVCL